MGLTDEKSGLKFKNLVRMSLKVYCFDMTSLISAGNLFKLCTTFLYALLHEPFFFLQIFDYMLRNVNLYAGIFYNLLGLISA